MASRPPLPLALAALAAAAIVTGAARAPQPPAAAPTEPPPVPAATDSMADSTTTADSTATPTAVIAPAPAPVAPSAWPVDPVTGLTLVNGTPVVGRVFIQHKTDHLVKMGTVAQVVAREALPAAAPVTDTEHTPAPPAQARRFRGIMVQATLWDMDHKRTAAERRYFRSTTTAP